MAVDRSLAKNSFDRDSRSRCRCWSRRPGVAGPDRRPRPRPLHRQVQERPGAARGAPRLRTPTSARRSALDARGGGPHSRRAVQAVRNNPYVEYVERDPPRYPLAQTMPYGIKMVQADQVSDTGAGGDHGLHHRLRLRPTATRICRTERRPARTTSAAPVPGTRTATVTARTWREPSSRSTTALGVLGVLPERQGRPPHRPRVRQQRQLGLLVGPDRRHQTCRDNGAKVISMSLGCNGTACSSTAENAQFESLYSQGILSFAAAGNAGNTALSYPAGYDKVISVGAVAENKALATFSQRNADVELVAPGVAVLSTVPDGHRVRRRRRRRRHRLRGFGARGLVQRHRQRRAGRTAASAPAPAAAARQGLPDPARHQHVRPEGAQLPGRRRHRGRDLQQRGRHAQRHARRHRHRPSRRSACRRRAAPSSSASWGSRPRSRSAPATTTSSTAPRWRRRMPPAWRRWSGATTRRGPTRQVRTALRDSAEDLGTGGRDTSYGFGLIRAQCGARAAHRRAVADRDAAADGHHRAADRDADADPHRDADQNVDADAHADSDRHAERDLERHARAVGEEQEDRRDLQRRSDLEPDRVGGTIERLPQRPRGASRRRTTAPPPTPACRRRRRPIACAARAPAPARARSR